MFSCCLGITRGSEPKKEKRGGHGGGHGGTRRSRVHSWFQRLWPFGRRETNSTQGSQGQDHTNQVAKESAPKDLKESCRKACFSTLEEVVIHLVISLQTGDPSVVLTFICIHQRFVTMQQVPGLLFKQYAYFYPDCEEDEEVMDTIFTFLDIRTEKFPEDFCQASDLSILKQVKNYLIVNIPHSDVLIHVNELLTQLQTEVASVSEASTEEASEMPASASHP